MLRLRPKQRFSRQVRRALSRSGWTEGRSVNIDAYARKFKADGYRLAPSVEKFLREFGELAIPAAGETIEISSDYVDFVWPERVRQYEEAVGQSLVPVGRANGMVLLLGNGGLVLLGMDKDLFELATDFATGLEALVRGRRARRVPVPE